LYGADFKKLGQLTSPAVACIAPAGPNKDTIFIVNQTGEVRVAKLK